MPFFLVWFFLWIPVLATATDLPLGNATDYLLPGRPTRLDYASLDPHTHLLFIAHLGDGHVAIFDTLNHKVMGDLSGIDRVHGVLAVPELGRVYASATGTDEIVVIDEATLRITGRIPGGVYPDGMVFEPHTKRLYVSDEHGKTETVIDTQTNRKIATIALDSEAGNSQYDSATGHVFVAAQSSNAWIEIDPQHNTIIARHPIPGCDSPHGLLIDSSQHLAYIACQDNQRLITIDMRTMQSIASRETGPDPDVLAADPSLKRLYVASERGALSIFTLDRTTRLIGHGEIAHNAHVVTVDTTTHRVYFPLMNINGHPVLRSMEVLPFLQSCSCPPTQKHN